MNITQLAIVRSVLPNLSRADLMDLREATAKRLLEMGDSGIGEPAPSGSGGLLNPLPDYGAERCGHNLSPQECPYEFCGYRDTLKVLQDLTESLKPAAPANGVGLQVDIKHDSVVISLPLSALQTAAECWSDFQKWDSEKREYKKPKVTDVHVFAKEVLHELLHEEEDGSTPVTRLFDAAFRDAVEDGADGIVVPDDDWYDEDSTLNSSEGLNAKA